MLIYEYDNFANELMMGDREISKSRYEALLSGEGALKSLFKAVKSAIDVQINNFTKTSIPRFHLGLFTFNPYGVTHSCAPTTTGAFPAWLFPTAPTTLQLLNLNSLKETWGE
ncbi:MAG: hypothetical protein DRR19_07260 [Candidatus Parabeggiatoa sp. nov. 1]|nr:MAG: hypothetical protein DRR19_07260 [Gammaproteobacteria bacterium]